MAKDKGKRNLKKDRNCPEAKNLRAAVITGESFLKNTAGGGFTKAMQGFISVGIINSDNAERFDIKPDALKKLSEGTKVSGLTLPKRPLVQTAVNTAKAYAKQEYGMRL